MGAEADLIPLRLACARSYRLFLLSFAVQHALDNPESGVDLPAYCVLCFESASKMIGESSQRRGGALVS